MSTRSPGRLREAVSDAIILAAAAAVAYGVWQIHPPSAWIAAGLGSGLVGWRIGIVEGRG